MNSNRRTFVKGTLVSAASLYLPTTWSRAIGANEEIRLAVIGARGQGKNHMGQLVSKMKKGNANIRVTAMCDADQEVLDGRKADLEKESIKAAYYQDYRKLLEDKNVDAVIIATPNHLHTLIAISALEAGKHVYVEKPVSHNIWEGRQLAKYAEKHAGKLICQHGMQRRSDNAWFQIKEWIKAGNIGKPILTRGLCYKPRESIGLVGTPQAPPKTVDYDLWSGPRNPEPVPRKKLHYDWHWQWQWGNGDIGNQGPHQLDVARWLIDDPQECPSAVLSIGGRFGYEDDATTANTQIAYFDFKPVPMIFEVRGLPDANLNFKGPMSAWKKTGVRVGNILHCEGGYVAEGVAYDNDNKRVHDFKLNDGAGHQERFFESIRSLKQAPTHTALNGHLSAALAHMANTSYRLGKQLNSEEVKAQIGSNALYAESYDRLLEHIAKNGVDIKAVKVTSGPMLAFDGKAEKYIGNLSEEANKLDDEVYREPFQIKRLS